ncbi:hypothetical protein Gasu2_15880 [Galdieria sulphuraria]|nr:hypothetical protein Gasu2_15880 [Galdieria sulphuraria]
MLGECLQISYSYPSTYIVQVPRGLDVHVVLGSKVLINNRTLYKILSTSLFPPVNIATDIPDCRESGFEETILKANDTLLDTSFIPSLCALENVSLIEGRVYESVQGGHRIQFQGYLEENSLDRFLQDDAPASFLSQIGQVRPRVYRSFDSFGLHVVTIPEVVHKARCLVIGGGGAGGTAFGDTTVAPGDKLKVYVGKGGSGGNLGCGGGDGTFSGFVRLSGGDCRDGNPGSTSGPGSGGTVGGAGGRTVKEEGSGSNGAASQGGSGGNPYEYELYNNGEGGI